jgi:chaperonin GroES
MKSVQPINDNVVIKPEETSQQKSSGGIYIPDTAKEKPQEGKVLAVSKDAEGQLNIGDLVIFKKYAGTETTVDGQELIIVPLGDVLAKIVETDAIPD